MDLVLDIGNFRLKGAFFEGDQVKSPFVLPLEMGALKQVLEGKAIEATLISSVNDQVEPQVKALFDNMGFPYRLLDFSTMKVKLDVDEPEALGHDRIANVYGALTRFPQNNCVVVDLGTAVTFDFVGCEGCYLGGAIYPGIDIGAKALAEYTDKLPEVPCVRPETAVAKTTETHIQSGLYWGLLGAVERLIFEMRQSVDSPSDVKVIATGGLFRTLQDENFTADISDLVDLIDPMLTLVGLHEIMKEK